MKTLNIAILEIENIYIKGTADFSTKNNGIWHTKDYNLATEDLDFTQLYFLYSYLKFTNIKVENLSYALRNPI